MIHYNSECSRLVRQLQGAGVNCIDLRRPLFALNEKAKCKRHFLTVRAWMGQLLLQISFQSAGLQTLALSRGLCKNKKMKKAN